SVCLVLIEYAGYRRPPVVYQEVVVFIPDCSCTDIYVFAIDRDLAEIRLWNHAFRPVVHGIDEIEVHFSGPELRQHLYELMDVSGFEIGINGGDLFIYRFTV